MPRPRSTGPCRTCGGTVRTKKGACVPCKKAYDRKYITARRKAGKDKWYNRVTSPQYRLETKLALLKALKSDGCAHCDFRVRDVTDVAAIDFHHRDPKRKRFSVAVGVSQRKSMRQLLEEAKKCEVLCANCHRIHHARAGDMAALSRAGQERRNGLD